MVLEVKLTLGNAKPFVPVPVSAAFKSSTAAAFGAPSPPILTCAFTLAVPKPIGNSKNIKKSTFFIFFIQFFKKNINICLLLS
jgi:hypothetical protein